MKAALVNFNFTPTWLLDSGLNYVIYDRSDSKDYLKDFPQERIFYTQNIGQVDWDKLGCLIDNYDTLPDVFLWGKTNLFKYVTEERWSEVKDTKDFTPLLKYDHPAFSDPSGVCCYYDQGIYWERSNLLWMGEWRFYENYPDFARAFEIPYGDFVPFAPGGNYILTKEVVHKYPKDFYARMRSVLPYCSNPPEAHWCERVYFTLWH